METAVAYYKSGVPYDDKGQVIITLLNGTPDGSGSGGGGGKGGSKSERIPLPFMQLLNGLLLN